MQRRDWIRTIAVLAAGSCAAMAQGTEEDSVITPPRLIAPQDGHPGCYPIGSVMRGRARGPQVIGGSGDARLDKAGACVLRELRFKPTLCGDQAVKATIAMDLLVRPARSR